MSVSFTFTHMVSQGILRIATSRRLYTGGSKYLTNLLLFASLWLWSLTTSAQSIRYEAEQALLAGSASIGTNSSGNVSSGRFVEWMTNPGASVKFSFPVTKSGRYYVTLRYSTGNSNPTSLSLYLNNSSTAIPITLPGTGGWNSWYSKTEILTLTASAPPASSTITAEYRVDNSNQGWVNLDYMWVSAVAANGPVATPITTGDQLVVSRFTKLSRGSLLGMASCPTSTGEQLLVYEHTDGIIYNVNSDGSYSERFDVKSNINTRPSNTRDTYFDKDYVRYDYYPYDIIFDSGVPRMGNSAHGGLQGVAYPPGFNTPGSPFYQKFYTAVMETEPGTYGSQPAAPLTNHHYLTTALIPAQTIANVNHPPTNHASGHDGVLIEWDMSGSTPQYREVFRVRMPVFDHSIKRIAFNPYARQVTDPDYGVLYIAHGDGSEQSAKVGGGQGNDALGKILRINPLATSTASYTIPADNPTFPGAVPPEVYAMGFRNPHTFSFAKDASNATQLIVGEAGRDNVEEVNIVVAGGNYGWPLREGTFEHYQQSNGSGNGIVQGVGPLQQQDSFVYPAAQWGHNGDPGNGYVGQANAGGFVFNALNNQKHYPYADFANAGRIFYSNWQEMLNTTRVMSSSTTLTQAAVKEYSILFDDDNDPTTRALPKHSMLDVVNADLAISNPARTPSTRVDIRFGQGVNGELYILTKQEGLIYKVQGVVPASGITSTYEAEDAILSQPPYTTPNSPPTVRVGTGALNYRARGFVEWMGPGASVHYDDVTVPVSGTYLVTLRYAAAGGGSLTLYVNNVSIGQSVYPATGSWGNWQKHTVMMRLIAGRSNTIRYQVDGANPANAVNLDYIEVRPHTYEAEDAQISGGNASIGNYWQGYRASGFVENITGLNESVRFAVQVPSAGNYPVTLRYAAAAGSDGSMKIKVYDKFNNLLSDDFVTFPRTSTNYDWSVWGNQTLQLNLPAETAYIEYSHDAGTAGNINLDYIGIGFCTSCSMACNPCAQRIAPQPTVTMFPNPASTYVQFELVSAGGEGEAAANKDKTVTPSAEAALDEPYFVSLYDNVGQLRWQGKSDNSHLMMNVAKYPQGLYHVIIKHGSSVSRKTVSIER